MSIAAILEFGQKVSEDSALQQEVQESVGMSIPDLMQMDVEQLRAADRDYLGIVQDCAAKHGYEFSKAELEGQISMAMAAGANDELSDEALEAVAGGKGAAQVPGNIFRGVGTVYNTMSDYTKGISVGYGPVSVDVSQMQQNAGKAFNQLGALSDKIGW